MIPARERRRALAVALVAGVIAAGCAPARLRPELPATLPDPARLLEILAARRATVHSMRGFAQIAYESGEENIGSRHAVLARRPDHFRLEVLSPFGALAVVACDGRELVVYARRESTVYRGAATAGNIGAYTAVPLPVEDVVTMLLGMPPARAMEGRPTVARDEAAGLVRLTLAAGRQEIWFSPDTLYPVASESALPDGRTLRVDFGDFRTLGSFAFPYSVDMRAVPGDRSIRVRWTSPSLNTEISDGLFVFPPRDGLTERRIEQYTVGGAPQ